MGSKASSAPAPDPRLIEAQIGSMGVQNDAIKQIMANNAGLAPLQKLQLQQAIDAQTTASKQNAEQYAYSQGRQKLLTGLQDQAVADANKFSTKDEADRQAGLAMSDINTAAANARGQNTRAMSRMGLDPNSGRALAVNADTTLGQTAASAGAANMARTAARQMGWSLQDRAAAGLSGSPAMSMATTQAGAGFGSAGLGLVNSGLAGMNSGYQTAGGLAGQMGSNAAGMYGAMGNYKLGQDQLTTNSDPFNTILGAAAAAGTKYGLGKIT